MIQKTRGREDKNISAEVILDLCFSDQSYARKKIEKENYERKTMFLFP